VASPPPLPARLTRAQSRRVDLICAERFGIPSILLMENAARALVEPVLQLLAPTGERRVLIVCGGGNNGGDGFAAARHLHNAGCQPLLLAATPVSQLTGDAATHAQIAGRIGLPIEPATPDRIRGTPAELIIDALLGTGLDQPPREPAAALIRAMNARGLPILAVDLPSGLDCDTGRPPGPPEHCIRAEVTVTMVAEKAGFPLARDWTGKVIVAGIGAPPEAVRAAVEAPAG
jgi:NAD(P)H-hydrate epimerase